MNGRVNNKIWPAIWVFVLFLAEVLWNCGIVRGQTQVLYPADGEVIIGENYPPNPPYTHIYTWLDFIPGPNAVKHTGYFSDNYEDVANRIEDANLGEPPYPSMPNRYYVGLPLVEPYTDSLVRGETYYWTVDETDAVGNIYLGDIWEFAIHDFYAFAPNPPNEAVVVETDVLLSWSEGAQVNCHDVYIGTSWDDVNDAVYDPLLPPPEFLGMVPEPNILVTGLSFNTKYYWRVDEVYSRCPCMPICGGVYYKGDVWCFTTKPSPIYVDVDAGGANNGASWEEAYNYLQDALIDANSSVKPVEIWVAQGIYKPDRSTSDPKGSGDRAATFKLINGVTVKGGYAGFGEPNPNARDIELYETILSGDLNDDDVDISEPWELWNNPLRADNSYNVVTGSGTNASAILDGFTITGGYANGSSYSVKAGAGMCSWYGSPTVVNCIFYANFGELGGGMSCEAGNPELTDCVFQMNYTRGLGGGMDNNNSSLILTRCMFRNNIGHHGGGMSNRLSSPKLINCIFLANDASSIGGGIYVESGSPVLSNCIFSENQCGIFGGGLYGSGTLTNCILWGDMPDEINSSASVLYSDVRGGWPGDGNIDADPCFVDAGGGDFRLSSDSPCIDAGDNSAPNLPDTDMVGHPRIIDGDCNDTEVVDMGAYEFNYAYMGDFDYNCDVDFADLSIFGFAWMTEPGDHNWDPICNISVPADSLIDWRDAAIVCNNWLAEIP